MNKRILVIEDDLQLANYIKSLLEAQSFFVSIARDGREGINFAKRILPDLIICDIKMPVMDGYQVKRELNKNVKTLLIPFIFLTVRIEHKNVRMGMNLGADDYLFKPLHPTELFASINTRLKKVEKIKSIAPENKTELKKQKEDPVWDDVLVSINSVSAFINPDKIKYIIADRQYSSVTFKNDKNIILRKSLNHWEKILPQDLFVRIHRKTIVNINEIEQIIGTTLTGLKVVMKDRLKKFEISRRFAHKAREKITVHKIYQKIY